MKSADRSSNSITRDIRADNLKTAFDLLSQSTISNLVVKNQNEQIEISLPNISSTAYREMLVDVLGMRGLFKKAIRENIQAETASSHGEEEVSLFSTELNHLDWLIATISYDADIQKFKLFIGPQKRLSSEKIKRLIESITTYRNDSVNDSIEIHCDDQGLEASSDTYNPADEENEEGYPQDRKDSGDSSKEAEASRMSPHNQTEPADYQFSSTSSHQRIYATDAPVVLVDVILTDKQDIQLIIGKARTDTKSGKTQNDHVIAWGLFIRSLLATIDDTPIDEIPDLLITSAQFHLPEEHMGLLQKIKEQYIKKLKTQEYLSRMERKELTRKMRKDGYPEKQVEAVKLALKSAKASFIAQLIKDLTSEIIHFANKHPEATFTGAIPKTKQELGKEGAHVRLALQSLSAFDKLLSCIHEIDPKKQEELTKKFSKTPSYTQGLNQFKNEDSLEFIKNLLEKITPGHAPKPSTSLFAHGQQKKTSDELPPRLADELCKFITNLFDFNYYRRMSAELFSHLKLELSKAVGGEEIIKKLTGDELIFIVSKHISGINPSNSERVMLEKNGLLNQLVATPKGTDFLGIFQKIELAQSEIFKTACCRHFGFIISSFPQLKKYFKDAALMEKYITSMLQSQSWDNAKFINQSLFSSEITDQLLDKFKDIFEITPALAAPTNKQNFGNIL